MARGGPGGGDKKIPKSIFENFEKMKKTFFVKIASFEAWDHHNWIPRVLKWVFLLIFSLKGAFYEIEPKY